MKSIFKSTYEKTSSKIAPIRTRPKAIKQEQTKAPFQNNFSSSSSISQSHTSDYDQCPVLAYKCGCDYSTDSIHSFKNHVIDAHRGEFIEGSTHFLSGTTKVVLPFIDKKHQSSWSKNESTSNDCEWKTKLKEPAHQIWWNGFVLIKKRSLKREAFYCGHCRLPFARIIDFINHCLIDCGQLQNEDSSHFIYDEADWKAKVKEKQCELKSKPKPIIQEHKTRNQTEPSKSDQIEKYLNSSDFHQKITNFTINYFSIPRQIPSFKFRHAYIYISDKIIYDNLSQQNSHVKRHQYQCFTCCNTFIHKYDFYKHLYVSGEEQDVRSSLLVFNKDVFYQANQEKMKSFLSQQKVQIKNFLIDCEFVKYLSKRNALPIKFHNYVQSMLRCSGIIKSFFIGWNNFEQVKNFRCQACGYISQYISNPYYFKHVYAHIYQGNKQCYSQNYAFIYLDDIKLHVGRAKVILDLKSRYLEDENFICPCQKAIALSKVQFVNHVVKEHQGVIHVKFYTEPSIFE